MASAPIHCILKGDPVERKAGDRERGRETQNIITSSDLKDGKRSTQKPMSSRPKKRVVKRELT